MFKYFNSHWTDVLLGYVLQDKPLVLVTVVKVEGSAPRKTGARMFVFEDQIIETIGGGNLEFETISLARKMINNEVEGEYKLEHFGLGPALQQCCGGTVTLAMEKILSMPDWLSKLKANASRDIYLVSEFNDLQVIRRFYNNLVFDTTNLSDTSLIEKLYPLKQEVVIFGAGHIGHALINTLIPLPFEVSWVDERAELFPAELSDKVKIFTGKSSLSQIDKLPDQALNIVMTHSHELDEDICYTYLKQKEFAFLGLIGSKTKRARFLHRLRDRGISQEGLSRLICPIGITQVMGNSPPEIAISIAAQLLTFRN